MSETIIGIDLGTTHSAAAYMDGATPRLIPNAVGGVLTPSIVGIDLESRVVVGAAARELQVTHPERAAALFKRKMGTDWSVDLAGRTYSPEELSALVLRSLKQDAEAHLDRPVSRAVITVPAYFNEHQRKATINAGKIAGLTVERILNEPTAAALAYGVRDAAAEKVFLVFDLGGGTFDVSVVEVMEGVLEVRASSGEGFLGGEDFTRTMAARVLDRCNLTFERAEAETPLLVSRFLQQCEAAKRTLTREDSATVRVPDRLGQICEGARVETVSREDFQRWTGHLMARIDAPLRRALMDAGLKRHDIEEVLLVGGATRMPAVVDHVHDLFGKAPQGHLNPDEVVALGAAIQAGLIGRESALDELVVTDVAPFTLGIEISKAFGREHHEGYFLPVIHRNTTIPVSRVQSVSTITPNQREIVVKIFQGEGRKVEDNLPLGEFRVKGIPAGPVGQEVEIRFTYDLNGVLEVEGTVVATRQKFTHVVTKHARGLSHADIERAVQDMQALKTHPREESVNRYLLLRAERIYGELSPDARHVLEQLLDGFESALEVNEPGSIELHRDALERFLASWDFTGNTEGEPSDGAW